MQILGIDFFEGTPADAVDQALGRPGLVVAPSGTCFRRLTEDPLYRAAITGADLVLPDSGLMVLLWRLLRRNRIERISGLVYLQALLSRPEMREPGAAFWVLPNEEAREKTAGWLDRHGFNTPPDHSYIAPLYDRAVDDPRLRDYLETHRPQHVIIALSGGVQEKLGFYLRNTLTFQPAIHCLGAALGFVTGYQVAIPNWADRLYLGWLFRLVSNPRRFLPRALSALALPGLILRYGERMPPLSGSEAGD